MFDSERKPRQVASFKFSLGKIKEVEIKEVTVDSSDCPSCNFSLIKIKVVKIDVSL